MQMGKSIPNTENAIQMKAGNVWVTLRAANPTNTTVAIAAYIIEAEKL